MNTLLDTLIRPNADTELNPTSCIEWRYEPEKAIPHVAIGDTQHAGGQWADNPVSASADIGTLSYAEQLSLPGYSYADHLATKEQLDQCDFVRPSRTEFADYLRAYPSAVGIADSVYTRIKVDDIRRRKSGFKIESIGIRCDHLVLASGIFTVNIPPPPMLAPIANLDIKEAPLLVVGSGFSAADLILSAPPMRRILHIYQWAPDQRPSPLRGCHHTAYPEYAAVYRQMKLGAIASKPHAVQSPMRRRKSNPFFQKRDWGLYEGMPNAEIISVSEAGSDGTAIVKIRLTSGEEIIREAGGLGYVVGRRGELSFVSEGLRHEILDNAGLNTADYQVSPLLSSRTLRAKAESSLEIAKNVFITGSLTGDSLIRHAVGGCVFAAGRIMDSIPATHSPETIPTPTASTPRSASPVSTSDLDSTLNSTNTSPSKAPSGVRTPGELTNGHSDLHLDRRTMARAVDFATAENQYWIASGWWDGAGLSAGRYTS